MPNFTAKILPRAKSFGPIAQQSPLGPHQQRASLPPDHLRDGALLRADSWATGQTLNMLVFLSLNADLPPIERWTYRDN